MDLTHLSWPFFDSDHLEFARKFDRWVRAELGEFERDEGGDGRAARQIFELFANSGWLKKYSSCAANIQPSVQDLPSEGKCHA